MQHLQARWKNLFNADCDILLYDLSSTYFEGEMKEAPMARRGYSRDHRPDCLQVVVALVVSAEGFPLRSEVFQGNRTDVTTCSSWPRAWTGRPRRAPCGGGSWSRLQRSLVALQRLMGRRRKLTAGKIERRLGQFEERYSKVWPYLEDARLEGRRLCQPRITEPEKE